MSHPPRRAWAVVPVAVLVVAGGVDAWAGWGSYLTPDSVSYVDMAAAIATGHLAAAINGYWSPLYPSLLSLFMRLGGVDAASEFAMVRVVNFLVFLVAVAAFRALLRRVLDLAIVPAPGHEQRPVPLTRGQLAVAGWAGFAWAAFSLHSVSWVSPDTCAMAAIFASLAALFSLDASRPATTRFAGFGILLGLGYWAKAVLLPLGPVFLCAALIRLRGRDVRRPLAISAVALALVAAPLVVAISIKYHRVSPGESGSLNYAWYVNGVSRFVHWQGGPPGSGAPTHATRRFFSNPDVFEFATPIVATYAPWYDPAYWYEGRRTHVDVQQQLRLAVDHARFLGRVLRSPAFMVPLAILAMSVGAWRDLRPLKDGLRTFAPIWMVCAAGLAAYLAVHVEARYFAPFLAPIPLLLVAAIRIPRSMAGRVIGHGVIAACVIAAGVTCGPRLTMAGVRLIRTRGDVRDANWAVATAFAGSGIAPGTPVAFIGPTLGIGWARLARLRIVAQVPRFEDAQHQDENMTFWKSPPPIRDAVLQAFARSGARWAIANDVPAWADTTRWQPVPGSAFFYRVIEDSDGRYGR